MVSSSEPLGGGATDSRGGEGRSTNGSDVRGAAPAPDEEHGPKIVSSRGPTRRAAFAGGPDGPVGGAFPGPVPFPAASFWLAGASQTAAPRSWGQWTVAWGSPHFAHV